MVMAYRGATDRPDSGRGRLGMRATLRILRRVHRDLDLTLGQRMVVMGLVLRADGRTGEIPRWWTYRRLAADTGLSVHTVASALASPAAQHIDAPPSRQRSRTIPVAVARYLERVGRGLRVTDAAIAEAMADEPDVSRGAAPGAAPRHAERCAGRSEALRQARAGAAPGAAHISPVRAQSPPPPGGGGGGAQLGWVADRATRERLAAQPWVTADAVHAVRAWAHRQPRVASPDGLAIQKLADADGVAQIVADSGRSTGAPADRPWSDTPDGRQYAAAVRAAPAEYAAAVEVLRGRGHEVGDHLADEAQARLVRLTVDAERMRRTREQAADRRRATR